MQNRMQPLRPKTATLLSFTILFGGMSCPVVFSQQLANVAGPSSPKSDTDPKPAQTEKAEDSVKPLTSRPDPRKTAVPDKTEPKTERQKADERKVREAARKRGEMTFDDLKFDIEKGAEFKPEMITQSLKDLDKKTFTLRGFILPLSVSQQSGIKQFVLVRDNQECCFGPGAAIYDCVWVEMAPGKSTNFATRVVTVKGKFEIDTESFHDPEGGHYAIFKMTADEVK